MIQNVVALRVKFRSREISFIVIVHITVTIIKKKDKFACTITTKFLMTIKKKNPFRPIPQK